MVSEDPAVSRTSGIAWERVNPKGEAWGQDPSGLWHAVMRSGACHECGAHHAVDYDQAWADADHTRAGEALGPYRCSAGALDMLEDAKIPGDVRQLAQKSAQLAAQSLGAMVPAVRWFANDGAGTVVYGVAVAEPWSIALREDLRGRKLVETTAHEVAHSAKPKAPHDDVYAWAASFADNHRDLWEHPPITTPEWQALKDRDRVARAEVASLAR